MFPLHSFWLWLLLTGSFALAFYLSLNRNQAGIRLLMPSMVLIVVLNFFLNFHVAPQIFSDQASVKAAKIFDERAAENDKLYNYNYGSYELFFYSKSPAVWLVNDLAVVELLKEPGNWIFTYGKVVNRIVGDFMEPEIIPLEHVWITSILIPIRKPAIHSSDWIFRSQC